MYHVIFFAIPAYMQWHLHCVFFSARESLAANIRIESRLCESICAEPICEQKNPATIVHSNNAKSSKQGIIVKLSRAKQKNIGI